MKNMMVLTSHDRVGDTGRKTGFWLEEFAAPSFVFRDRGVQLTLASPKGGQLTHVLPFLVDLTRLGATFEKAPNWQPFSIVDGRLVTGQNPASSTGAAQPHLRVLASRAAA